MKKLPAIILMLLVSSSAFSQPTTDPSPAIQTDYLKKSKHQKTAARIMMGGGSVLAVTGFTISLSDGFGDAVASAVTGDYSSSGNTIDIGSVFLYTGVAAMLGSIPLFNAAHKNKKKAKSLSFKNETAPQLQNGSFSNQPVSSLTLKISL